MTEIVLAATPRQREDAFAVRIAVFVDEQGIAREEELDDLDATAVHVVGYEGHTPVAAGRMVAGDGYAKIGRMAVLADYRGRGIGAKVLELLEHAALDRGIRSFKLSAQVHAEGFYRSCGYMRVGDVYDEVGIPHVAMEKVL